MLELPPKQPGKKRKLSNNCWIDDVGKNFRGATVVNWRVGRHCRIVSLPAAGELGWLRGLPFFVRTLTPARRNVDDEVLSFAEAVDVPELAGTRLIIRSKSFNQVLPVPEADKLKLPEVGTVLRRSGEPDVLWGYYKVELLAGPVHRCHWHLFSGRFQEGREGFVRRPAYLARLFPYTGSGRREMFVSDLKYHCALVKKLKRGGEFGYSLQYHRRQVAVAQRKLDEMDNSRPKIRLWVYSPSAVVDPAATLVTAYNLEKKRQVTKT